MVHVLTITVDQIDVPLTLPVLRQGNRWFLRREHLRRFPLQPPRGWLRQPSQIALDRANGFALEVDHVEQAMHLTVPADWHRSMTPSLEVPVASEPPALPPPPSSTDVLHALTIRLNRVDEGWVLPVLRRDERWYMSRDNLHRLPLRPPQGWDSLPTLVPLDREFGFEADYDASEQRMELTAPVEWLGHRYTWIGGVPTEPVEPPTRGPSGLVLNYDLGLSQTLGSDAASGRSSRAAIATEWRWFNQGTGTLTHTQLNQFRRVGGGGRYGGTGHGGDDGGWHGDSVRLDTRWQESRPDRLLRWEVGDAITDPGTGMHALRFGGLKIGTDFDLQPYLVTSALPTWFGATALPSTVDLYIDGMRRYHGEAAPGTIALDNLPGVSGSGQATIVVTDALGRRRTVELPFYASTKLLRAGLTGWSFSMGHARLGYGLESNRYDERLLASGRIRHGVTPHLTVGAAFETSEGVRTLGFLGAWAPGNVGVLTPSLSISDATDPVTGAMIGGSRLGLGYEWANRWFSFNAEAARTTDGYRDVGSLYGARWPRSLARLGLGWSLGMNGSIGLNWLRQIDFTGAEGRYLSANWYRNIGAEWGISVALTRSRTDRNETIGWLSLTRSLGPRLNASVQHTTGAGRDNTTVAVSQMMTSEDRTSWRVQTTTGSDKPAVQADYVTELPLARTQAQLYARGNEMNGWLGAQGAMAWMAGHRLATRSIPDAFGLVSTDGVAGVTVRVENRRVGETNSDGLLIAPLHG